MERGKDRMEKANFFKPKAGQSKAELRQAELPDSLQKQLIALTKRSNSPIRELNMETIQTLKESGYLDFALFNSGVKKEEDEVKNSLPIELQDIQKAFKIIDERNGPEKVTVHELKKKMEVINPELTEKDIMTLMNQKNEISAKALHDLLRQNELGDFDPLGEAFRLLDDGTGELDFDKLKAIFKSLNYGELEKKDTEILYECLDIDKDGKITIDDFRELFDYLGRPNPKYALNS